MSNLYGKSCTPNLGGVSDYYTKAQINKLLSDVKVSGILSLQSNNILVGNQSNTGTPYLLNPGDFTIDHSQQTVSIKSGSIGNSDINPNAKISVSKLADGLSRQLIQTSADGTSVEWTSNVYVPGTLDVVGNATFSNDLVVAGDLVVGGSEVITNVETVTVEDKNIELARVTSPTDTTADGGGIILLGSTDKTFIWSGSTESWTSSENLDLASGKTYKINGVEVLSSTTLGASVQISSANIPSGTVTSDDLAGSISDGKLNTISSANKVAISSIDIDGGTDIGSSLSDSDLFIVDDGGAGANRKTQASRISSFVFGKISGDITVTESGVSSITSGSIVDSDISSTAEIAVSKLADGSARQILQTDSAGAGVEWTSNVDVPGTLDVTGVGTFDTKIKIGTSVSPVGQQEIAWNPDEETFDVGLTHGVINQLGQEIQLLCRNDDTVTIPNGAAVMFSGTVGNSGRIKVKRMISNGTYPGYVFLGVATQSISVGSDGFITTFGKIRGIPTNINEGGGVVWADGDILWCDPNSPGGFTKVEPQAPNLKLPVAAVINAANNGTIMVRWDTGKRLADLHDVNVNGGTSDKDILSYNESQGVWQSRSLPSPHFNLPLYDEVVATSSTLFTYKKNSLTVATVSLNQPTDPTTITYTVGGSTYATVSVAYDINGNLASTSVVYA